MRLTRMHPRRQDDPERGVALVEFALVALFLFAIGMGMVEYGLAYQGQEHVLGASRTGVRTTASLGTDVEADYQALSSLRADLLASDLLGQVEVVVIYKSDNVNGQPPAACVTSPPAATTQLCNIFTQAQVQNLSKTTFSTTTGCSTATGTLSSKWCPNIRNDNQLSADYVGMYVRIRHPFITKLYGSSMAISQRSVMRIEPSGG